MVLPSDSTTMSDLHKLSNKIWSIACFLKEVLHKSFTKLFPVKNSDWNFLSALPPDILVLILSKVPVKSIYKLRFVSQYMFDFIYFLGYERVVQLPQVMSGFFSNKLISESDPGRGRNVQFSSLRLRIHAQPLAIDVALDFLPISPVDRQHLSVLHSSCGLLLLLCRHENLFVCNPAMMMWSKIPLPPLADDRSMPQTFLAFDPSSFPRYTVVSFPLVDLAWDSERINVFSQETGIWTERQVPLLGNGDGEGLFQVFPQASFSGGVLYVLINNVLTMSPFTLAFDLEQNTFRRIMCPGINGVMVFGHCLGHSAGLLHLAGTVEGNITVWVLEHPESSQFVLRGSFGLNDEIAIGDQVEVQALQGEEAGEHNGDEVEDPNAALEVVMMFHPEIDVFLVGLADTEELRAYDFESDKVSVLNISVGSQPHVYTPRFYKHPDLHE